MREGCFDFFFPFFLFFKACLGRVRAPVRCAIAVGIHTCWMVGVTRVCDSPGFISCFCLRGPKKESGSGFEGWIFFRCVVIRWVNDNNRRLVYLIFLARVQCLNQLTR